MREGEQNKPKPKLGKTRTGKREAQNTETHRPEQ